MNRNNNNYSKKLNRKYKNQVKLAENTNKKINNKHISHLNKKGMVEELKVFKEIKEDIEKNKINRIKII